MERTRARPEPGDDHLTPQVAEGDPLPVQVLGAPRRDAVEVGALGARGQGREVGPRELQRRGEAGSADAQTRPAGGGREVISEHGYVGASVQEIARRLHAEFGDEVAQKAFLGLLADFAVDEDLRDRLRSGVLEPARASMVVIVERARARGQVRGGVEPLTASTRWRGRSPSGSASSPGGGRPRVDLDRAGAARRSERADPGYR